MNPWHLAHSLRRLLRGPAASHTYDVSQHRLAYVQSQWLVRAFYLSTLIVTFQLCKVFYDLVQAEGLGTPLWPIYWVHWLPEELAVRSLVLGLFAITFLVVLVPHLRSVRIAVFVLMLMTVAGRWSFGGISHYLHFWVWLSLVFVFFPLTKEMPVGTLPGPVKRHIAVSWFFAAQVMIAIFYSLSGLWKAVKGVLVKEGDISSFAPDALPSLVLGRWMDLQHPPLLNHFFLDNLWIGWPAHLLVIYVELFAVVAVFRPELHRFWGAALMAFHTGVWLVMGIDFPYQPMVVAMLFVFSPFAVGRRFSLKGLLFQLPLFGDLAGLVMHGVYSWRTPPRRSVGARSRR